MVTIPRSYCSGLSHRLPGMSPMVTIPRSYFSVKSWDDNFVLRDVLCNSQAKRSQSNLLRWVR